MATNHTDVTSTDVAAPIPIRRCACGRVAVARCWLGDSSPARWLVGCDPRSRLVADAPEAA